MTVLIHAHNSHVLLSGRRIADPIITSPCQDIRAHGSRPIGIVQKHVQRKPEDDHREIDLSGREIDMHLVVSVYSASVKKLSVTQALKRMNLQQMVEHVYCFQPL